MAIFIGGCYRQHAGPSAQPQGQDGRYPALHLLDLAGSRTGPSLSEWLESLCGFALLADRPPLSYPIWDGL